MSSLYVNDEIAGNISFNLLDYLTTKAFYINSIFEENEETAKMLLLNEIKFLIIGSSEDLPPVESAAALLVKKIDNKSLQKIGEEILGKDNINFFLKHNKQNSITIASIDTDAYESGDSFYIKINFYGKDKRKYDLSISEDNIYSIGFDKFINLDKYFIPSYLHQGILAQGDL